MEESALFIWKSRLKLKQILAAFKKIHAKDKANPSSKTALCPSMGVRNELLLYPITKTVKMRREAALNLLSDCLLLISPSMLLGLFD